MGMDVRQITPNDNAGRLDNASRAIGVMDGRVKTAVQLVEEMKLQISDLSSQMVAQAPDVSELSNDLGELASKYNLSITALHELRVQIVDEKAAAAACKENVDLHFGNEMLKVGFALGDDGKPKFKSESARKAATAANLAIDEEAQAARVALVDAQKAVDKTSAGIAMHEDLLKEYGRTNAALIARLNYTTAVLTAGA